MIVSCFPILEVGDLGAALDFYGRTLGGAERYRFPAEGEPAYVSLAMGRSELGLTVAERPVVPAGVVLWIYVDDVDEVTRTAAGRGAEVLEKPTDMPWGERVSLARDPFGHQVRIGALPASEETPAG
ncbi:VOC family protein [Solicola sp. PLA-1-18]|uniref:VOC family protein n=1 Tax=Solicola sp. PLA-1-18 TaxID=3380532 RepID=UPI003B7F08A0